MLKIQPKRTLPSISRRIFRIQERWDAETDLITDFWVSAKKEYSQISDNTIEILLSFL